MKKSTLKAINELSNQIINTSKNNGDFAYLFTATDGDKKDVKTTVNGDADQIFKMLATTIEHIAKSANVPTKMILEGILFELSKTEITKWR